jgi:hypothetical protein
LRLKTTENRVRDSYDGTGKKRLQGEPLKMLT